MIKTIVVDDGAIHGYFGLTYCSYLVLHRTVLQSMPLDWQEKFVSLLEEMGERCKSLPKNGGFKVQMKDLEGNIAPDPLEDYERGRRRL